MSEHKPSTPDPAASDDVLGGVVERAAYRALMGNRSFRHLFTSIVTSSLGDWVGVFAILALTESILGPTRAAAFALSGVMIARVLPTMLLGPVAGVFVDRWDRKRTMVASDIGRGLIFLAIPFANDVLSLFLATFFIETLSTLFIPAKDATVPNIVERERLVHANQLSLLGTYGTLPFGAGLFGLLAAAASAWFGASAFLQSRPSALPIWIDALTFFASAALIATIAVPKRTPRPPRAVPSERSGTGAWDELKEGLAFIANHPLVRALVVGVMAAAAAAGIVLAVGKLFATVLNSGDSGFGFLGAAVGGGLAAGLVLSGWAANRIEKERLFAPGIGVAGGGLIVVAFMPRLDIALVPAFIMGLGTGVGFVTGYTLLQEHSSDAVRGRTFAAFNTGVRLALFASLIVGPALVGVIGPERPSMGPNVVAEAANGIGSSRDVRSGANVTYPYQIGGVRIALMFAGLIALGGAVWTGRSIHKVLSSEEELSLAFEPLERPTGRGLFVAFEGGEGAGKSTQIRLLRAAVERLGLDVVTTREPGGTAIGEQIRTLLLDPASAEMTDRAEALLYAAARAQHAQEVIRPALDKGAVVLCDRYVDSSVVYQGIARGLGEGQVEELNRWGTLDLVPDVVILLDVDPQEGLRRVGHEFDRIEAAGIEFHRRVNEAFRHRAAEEPSRYVILNAARPAEDLHARIREQVFFRLGADASAARSDTTPDDVATEEEGTEDV